MGKLYEYRANNILIYFKIYCEQPTVYILNIIRR